MSDAVPALPRLLHVEIAPRDERSVSRQEVQAFATVSQNDVLLTFDERGPHGLPGGRKVVAVASRGVGFGPEFL